VLNVNKDLVKKWESIKEKAKGKKIVGLNTGCGPRWNTRLWPDAYWMELIGQLQKAGYYPVALGGTAEDVANAVAFLASDWSSYITGQVIQVCGGMLT